MSAKLLQDSARAFLRDAHDMERLRQRAGHVHGWDQTLWRQMAEMGWIGMRLPEPLGGAGLDLAMAAELGSVLGEAMVPDPFAACAVMPSAVLEAAWACSPSDRLVDLGRQLASADAVLALAWQGGYGALDPDWSQVRITSAGAGLRLRGRRMLVEAGATHWLVPASADGCACVVLVNAPRAGVLRQRASDGSVLVTAELDEAVLSDGILLRGDAATAAVPAVLAEGRLVQAATLCGLAQRLLEVSISHARDRRQFGEALADLQVVRHRLVDMHLQVEQANALWRQALAAVDARGDGAARAGSALHAASARAADAALSVARSAAQIHGAMGYAQDSPAGMGMVLAMRMVAAVGPADSHRRRAATRTSLEALAR